MPTTPEQPTYHLDELTAAQIDALATELDTERIRRIMACLEHGAARSTISDETVNKWLAEGMVIDTCWTNFCKVILHLRQELEQGIVRAVLVDYIGPPDCICGWHVERHRIKEGHE